MYIAKKISWEHANGSDTHQITNFTYSASNFALPPYYKTMSLSFFLSVS